jgi:beta-xylosidase
VQVTALRQVRSNPVYGSYFADPFVWQHNKAYYAIGTGELEANGRTVGKVFPVLQSVDFLQWQPAGSALERPETPLGGNFWAPEVAFDGGQFYLYYSVGHGDRRHQIRVATSKNPQGPYRDCGKTLIGGKSCPFAIDPHPFQDDNGKWYLFYARDFLDTTFGLRAGTALSVVRMKSMTETEGDSITVLRPRSDWQRFEVHRAMYGRVWDWHTLEGPFVSKRQGQYYCFYSGGCWESERYGIDFGVAEHVLGPYSDEGNEAGPRILRTVPHQVIGPGHNSVVGGPDGEDYIVYHAWDKTMKTRRMCMDKLAWTKAGPQCEGPTWTDALNSTL